MRLTSLFFLLSGNHLASPISKHGYAESRLSGARIGPTSNVINEHVDGLLVDPADPDDLADKILELLSDPSKREQMGRSGKNKTLARFTWDRIIDEMERIYRDVTKGR